MLRKNVAGQSVYFTLLVASTNLASLLATVTAYRHLDTAAQAAATGSVTELGNGLYRFDPSQADTNADFIGYLFTATLAIPVGMSFVTTAGNPHDAAAGGLTNLDATVSTRATQSSVDDLPTNAELATALGTADDAVLAAIVAVQADTDNIQTRLPAALMDGRMDSSTGAMAANVMTAAAAASDLATELQSGLASATELTALFRLGILIRDKISRLTRMV